MERRLTSCPVRWQPRRPCLRLMSTDLADPGTERNASHDQQQDLPTFDRACLRVQAGAEDSHSRHPPRTTSSRAASPSCPGALHRQSMGAVDPAAPRFPLRPPLSQSPGRSSVGHPASQAVGCSVGRNGAAAAPDAGPKRRCCFGEQQAIASRSAEHGAAELRIGEAFDRTPRGAHAGMPYGWAPAAPDHRGRGRLARSHERSHCRTPRNPTDNDSTRKPSVCRNF